MPPGAARGWPAHPSGGRGRSRGPRRKRPGVEALEPRTLLDAAFGPDVLRQLDASPLEPPPWVAKPDAAEPAQPAIVGKIGDALIAVTPNAEVIRPPVDRPGLVDYTWVVDRISFENSVFPFLSENASAIGEMARSHDTLQDAQVVDGPWPVAIGGVIRPNETADYFQIPKGAASIRVRLNSADAQSRRADRFFVFDEAGRMVGDWTLPSSMNEMSVELRASDNQDGHGFFVGVGPAPDGLDTHAEESYVIQIEPVPWSPPAEAPPAVPGRQDPPGTTSPGGPADGAPTQAPAATGGNASASATGRELPAPSSAAPLPLPAPVTGPLPARVSAPFGGVLATGDPLPTVGDDEGAQVDLPLVDLPLAPAPGELTEAVPPVEVPQGLIQVAEDGQLPLLAAAHPRAPIEGPPLEETLAVLDEVQAGAPACAAIVPNEAPKSEERETPRRGLPVALGLVTALAVTLTLPGFAPRPTFGRSRRSLKARLWRWLGWPAPGRRARPACGGG